MNTHTITFDLAAYTAYTTIVIGSAHAADTLPAVSPPTDWTGVAVAVGLAVLVVGLIALIQYWRRPGLQRGEEAFNRVYELLGSAHETIAKQATALEAQAATQTSQMPRQPNPGPAAPPSKQPTQFPWPDE